MKKGFTLVELLVVMAIIAILATVIIGGFRSSQMRGRDAQRKSDLKQIANALEIFFADYGKYPPASGTQLAGCSYNAGTGAGGACDWGAGEFKDVDINGNTKTIYFKIVPKDPASSQNYVYRVSSTQNMYQLFARLENPEDKNCIGGDCANPRVTATCGGGNLCNFGVTSTNTAPTDTLP